jgi:hypothetical protein
MINLAYDSLEEGIGVYAMPGLTGGLRANRTLSGLSAKSCGRTLPGYTFLEPSLAAGRKSQHPNYDVSLVSDLRKLVG